MGVNVTMIMGAVVVFAVVQGLEGYVITPRIVGEKVGLSPVVVIIALLLGGEILGLVGILLALPIAGIIRVLAPDFIADYRSTGLYTGTVDPDGASIGFIEAALAHAGVTISTEETDPETEVEIVTDLFSRKKSLEGAPVPKKSKSLLLGFVPELTSDNLSALSLKLCANVKR